MTTDQALRQGEYLVSCPVPILKENPSLDNPTSAVRVEVGDLIIVTQSCDLEQGKAQFVALCPIFPLDVYEAINPELKGKGRWEQVRKGRIEGLYLLSSPTNPDNNHEALVVDFGEIHSVPFDLLAAHAKEVTPRWRLKSPYLEHFSQAFARFFMRVGLPSAIPAFK
ncbi:MAG: hypothetical protein JNK38_28170 [Acidobacteria bacterium]|nr:hypothetical protein [Acidobacteriota bacterium]